MKKIWVMFFIFTFAFCFSQTDTSMVFTIVDEQAEYPGGLAEMGKFLIKNIHYPEEAIKDGISGRCFVRFVINKTGDITNVEVLKNVTNCPKCDEEVVRVIKSMPKWKPGKINGKPVKMYFNLPYNPHFH